MKKKVFMRGLFGIPVGITICYLITVLTSLIFGDGYYYPCVPVFAERVGSEIQAVMIQTALSALLGFAYAAGSVIWELENWSIAKQTLVYFLIASLSMFPIAYVANWMEHSLAGFLSYFGIFCVIFVTIWMTQYLGWKRKINKINRKISLDK